METCSIFPAIDMRTRDGCDDLELFTFIGNENGKREKIDLSMHILIRIRIFRYSKRIRKRVAIYMLIELT